MKEEKIEVLLNQEDVQNLVNCYEKDIEYIKQLETNWKELKKYLKETIKEQKEWDKKHNCEWNGYNAYRELLNKMQEIESGKNE